MWITIKYWAKPIPDRSYDWSAIDDDTYDGAEESPTRSQVGYGRTEAEAIADLRRLLAEIAESQGARHAVADRIDGYDRDDIGHSPDY